MGAVINIRRPRIRRLNILIVFLVAVCVILYTLAYQHKLLVLVRDIGYLTRPIWDEESGQPKVIIPHYYSPNLVNSTKLCELHGWRLRQQSNQSSKVPKVIDAFIFSIELDLLEIRMKELWDIVDIFLVLEADRTFTGKPKQLYLQNNLNQFDWAKDKLRHLVFDGLVAELPEHETPFYNEIKMRKKMSSWVHEVAAVGDLIIVSDVDEIPRPESIKLLKDCEGYPSTVHLQMTNYLYSFDYLLTSYKNWKPHVSVFYPFLYYHHGKASDYLLTDSGWHCSFCFRHLTDFVFKMTAYSHTDRLTNPSQASLDVIQSKICNGEDIFDMYPEAYSFKQLFASLGPIPKTNSVRFIPNYIIENSNKFKFLLPNGCIRS